MPKVTKHVSQGRAKEPMRCARCADPIVKGEEYYKWSIKAQRGGTTYQQHTMHGPVKASQLTHSKMSTAYAAVEDAESSVATAEDASELREALEACIGEIESVRDEYQESLDAMPYSLQQGPTGEQITEKIESFESFVGELQTAVDEIEDDDDDLSEDENKNQFDAFKETAENALGSYDF
jgi:hypothetical protein